MFVWTAGAPAGPLSRRAGRSAVSVAGYPDIDLEVIVPFHRVQLVLVLLAVATPLPPLAGAQAAPDSSRAPHTADQLIQQFRAAHQKHSLPDVERLVFWGGAAQELRRSTERHIADDFPLTIARVTIRPLASDERLEYTKDGVTYPPTPRPTLRRVGRLTVEFVPGSGAAAGVTSTSYLVGVRGGVYYIVSAEAVRH